MARGAPPFASEAQLSPAIAAVLAVAWVAAAVTVLLSLCATRNRKSSSKREAPESPSTANESATAETEEGKAAEEEQSEENKEAVTVIPVEGAAALHGPIPPAELPKSTSTKRKLSMTISRGMSERLKTSRWDRKGGGSGGGEESLWKKTIILGEKCRVGNYEGEEEVVVVDEKGNQERYHPSRSASRQVSRSNSFAVPAQSEALPPPPAT